jgi:NhaA family Na+:H+ antiporter
MAAELRVEVGGRDHVRGPTDAPVTLVEYGDYQCPQCGRAHTAVAEVRERLGDRVRFVFRHLPIPNVHPHALDAANAAEAAGEQGAFWDLHDWLFTHQDRLDRDGIAEGAREVGLDADAIMRAVADGAHAGRIEDDRDSALRSGATGTPTFFVNGRRHEGGNDAEALLAALRDAGA